MERSCAYKNLDVLSSLARGDIKLRKAILANAGCDVIDAISECALQIQEGVVSLPKPTQVKRWMPVISLLAKKNLSKGRKRALLLKVGQHLLNIILPPVISYLLSNLSK